MKSFDGERIKSRVIKPDSRSDQRLYQANSKSHEQLMTRSASFVNEVKHNQNLVITTGNSSSLPSNMRYYENGEKITVDGEVNRFTQEKPEIKLSDFKGFLAADATNQAT